MADLAKIVDDLASLTVLEAAEFSKMMVEKWGVSAAAPVVVAAAASAAQVATRNAEREVFEFDVILADAGESKINVIKEVRAITGLGLKEAKALVEAAPMRVKEGATLQEVQRMRERFQAVGATVRILPDPGDVRSRDYELPNTGKNQPYEKKQKPMFELIESSDLSDDQHAYFFAAASDVVRKLNEEVLAVHERIERTIAEWQR